MDYKIVSTAVYDFQNTQEIYTQPLHKEGNAEKDFFY